MTRALSCLDQIFLRHVTELMVSKALESRPSLREEAEVMENCKECLAFIQPLFVDHKKPAKALAMTVALLTYFRLIVLSNLEMAAPEVNWGEYYKFDKATEHSTIQCCKRGWRHYLGFRIMSWWIGRLWNALLP